MAVRGAGSLVRYAVEGGRLTASSHPHPKLYEPNRELKLSVFFVSGLVCAEICERGINVVELHPSARRLHGWGEFDESTVQKTGLRVDRDDNPPRHANIVDWPEIASERKEKQLLLAANSQSVRLNPPIQVKEEV